MKGYGGSPVDGLQIYTYLLKISRFSFSFAPCPPRSISWMRPSEGLSAGDVDENIGSSPFILPDFMTKARQIDSSRSKSMKRFHSKFLLDHNIVLIFLKSNFLQARWECFEMEKTIELSTLLPPHTKHSSHCLTLVILTDSQHL